jgi:glycosyltransferase involved in cell wall biosynthesis
MNLPGEENWELPAYTSDVFSHKAHAHVLVIPVINEGDRIRAQLDRIRAAHLPVDVVIADGGSTDGSLDVDFLRSTGVRALLTKTGPGKLSAQLRMAYAWCLGQGYAGIVTVDGNGKDNVEAVESFVAALQEGFDYVQGSRYRPGGKAKNTPLVRSIGNRLIHAPMLSIAGRRRFTDTTNGFRAYSARYLRDLRVQPFRDVFSDYSLLFYLTVRAGVLGFKVTEIAVTRSYPDNGRIPTKISSLAALVGLASEAVNAATGAYSPPNQPPQNKIQMLVKTQIIFFLFVFLALLLFAVSMYHRMAFSPDSWSYFELARSFSGDVYRIHVTRQFETLSGYSSSFPPLWPSLWFLTNRATGLGAASGYCLSMAAAALFLWSSELAGRRHFDTRWIGLAAAVLVVSHSGFTGEMLAGRTIPFQLALYAILLCVIVRLRTAVNYAIAGLCCGLTLMNRFDAMPFAIVTAMMVIFRSGAVRCKLAFVAFFLIVLAPWIYFSRLRFHRWFASDNSDIALRVDPTAFVTDWWPDKQATLVQEPILWLGKIANNAMRLVPSAVISPGPFVLALWVMAILIVWAFASVILIANPKNAINSSDRQGVREFVRQHQTLFLFYIAITSLLSGYVATGYFDSRYFVPQIWLTAFVLLGFIASKLANAEQRHLFGLIVATVFTGTTIVILARLAFLSPPMSQLAREQTSFDLAVARCIFSTTKNPVLLSVNGVDASRWSALYGWDTVILPANFGRLSAEHRKQFITIYQITHVHLGDRIPSSLVWDGLGLKFQAKCPDTVLALADVSFR